MLVSVCEPIVRKDRSSNWPKGGNGVDYEGSMVSFIKSSFMNSIQESSQLAASGSNSTGSAIVRETKKALAASCPTVFLKSSITATSRLYSRCSTSSVISIRCLDLKLTSQID